MPLLLVLLLVVVPLVEIAAIVQVGELIGVGMTILLLVADSIVGAVLLRVEGRRAWSDFRSALSHGRWPEDEVAQGALIILGGALLLTPGFVTDAVGFLLLLGPTRSLVSRILKGRLRELGSRGATGRAFPPARQPNRRPGRRPSPPAVDGALDVEVVEIEREQRPLGPDAENGGDDPRSGTSGR